MRRDEQAIGAITIAGTLLRLTPERMLELGRPLTEAASDLAVASTSSPLFTQRSRMNG